MTFCQGVNWVELGNASGAGREVLCYLPEVVNRLVGSFSEV